MVNVPLLTKMQQEAKQGTAIWEQFGTKDYALVRSFSTPRYEHIKASNMCNSNRCNTNSALLYIKMNKLFFLTCLHLRPALEWSE